MKSHPPVLANTREPNQNVPPPLTSRWQQMQDVDSTESPRTFATFFQSCERAVLSTATAAAVVVVHRRRELTHTSAAAATYTAVFGVVFGYSHYPCVRARVCTRASRRSASASLSIATYPLSPLARSCFHANEDSYTHTHILRSVR